MTDYAQTNVLEDRAETFSMMIGRSYALHGMFDQGSVLREKAKIISTQISQYFKTAPAGITPGISLLNKKTTDCSAGCF